jgi:DNA-binding LacI/PurR family transcriptional regulator
VLRPRLTTYRQDAEVMGCEAAAKLIELIEQPKTALPQQIMVSGKLLKGDTIKNIND